MSLKTEAFKHQGTFWNQTKDILQFHLFSTQVTGDTGSLCCVLQLMGRTSEVWTAPGAWVPQGGVASVSWTGRTRGLCLPSTSTSRDRCSFCLLPSFRPEGMAEAMGCSQGRLRLDRRGTPSPFHSGRKWASRISGQGDFAHSYSENLIKIRILFYTYNGYILTYSFILCLIYI